MEFFEEFGTHFVKRAHLGAMYGEQLEISAESWSNMVNTGIDIKASASYSGDFKNELFDKYICTGKSLSEVLIYSSINPQYDNRLFNDLRVQYKKITRGEHVKNMLFTQIV